MGPPGPVGATGAAGGGGAAIRAATVTVATPVTVTTATVTDAAVTPANLILVGWGAVVDTDANGPDTDNLSFSAVAGTGNFTVRIASERGAFFGAIKINYGVA